MLSRVFHDWERRLAAAAEHRLVRPFEWGLDWIDGLGVGREPEVERLAAWASQTVSNSDAFFALPPCDDYTLEGDRLSFPSAVRTPHEENNTVRARFFPDPSERGRRRAVVVLPQWNADAEGHMGLCRLLNRFGISALRLSLPYHDARMPPELRRADYIVSANVGRTAQVCRQAVLDARRAIAWLRGPGLRLDRHSRHEPRLVPRDADGRARAARPRRRAEPHLAVFRGRDLGGAVHLARQGRARRQDRSRDAAADLDADLAVPVPGARSRQALLLVYARYDLTFPVTLSKFLVNEFQRRGIEHEVAVLPCGHYSTGVTPFKWIDGIVLCRFLSRSL